jgi:hypothetical protein
MGPIAQARRIKITPQQDRLGETPSFATLRPHVRGSERLVSLHASIEG